MYEYGIRIGYSRVDEEKRLSIAGLIDLFQDCSTFQSEDLGIGFDYCTENGFFWVVNSWQVEIDRLPSLCENVSVFTYPVDFRGFVGKRCFGIKSGDDIIVRCYSIWSLLSIEDHRPVKMNEDMHLKYKTEEPLQMDKITRKINVPEGGDVKPPVIIEPVHLDANHHVNNGKYVSIASAYLPEGMQIKGFRAMYLAQAFLGDAMIPRVVQGPDGEYIVSLENSEGSPYAVMEFK
ncbi:MAG: acyl-[acyl-carrier-protein] thioesterase [Lachnospiraceae bacterium]|nr:acyl-[acyl-carrier-protein] thioesterase [Lachnospiraceae bacterium]